MGTKVERSCDDCGSDCTKEYVEMRETVIVKDGTFVFSYDLCTRCWANLPELPAKPAALARRRTLRRAQAALVASTAP